MIGQERRGRIKGYSGARSRWCGFALGFVVVIGFGWLRDLTMPRTGHLGPIGQRGHCNFM